MPSPRRHRNVTGAPVACLAALAAFSLIVTLLAPPAQAGDSTGPASARDVTASSLADTSRPVLFLKEVLVTGDRYPRAYYESPHALSFVSRLQMQERGATVVGDVLGTLPGVDMSKDSPWEQRPILRGLGGQRVIVLMDGSPVNSARGNGPHPSLVDPAQVERVEVVRGPSSVAYGSDALGGAINIITRQAAPAGGAWLRGAASLGGSTVDRQRDGYLELMPQIGKLSAFLSTGGRRALDYETPTSGRLAHSGFSDYNALANLRYPITGHMELKGGWQLYRGKDIGLPGLAFSMPGFAQEFSFPEYDRDAAHLTLEHHYPDAWLATTHAKVYWQREHRNFYSHEEAGSSVIGPGPGLTRITNQDRFFDLDTWGFQTQFTSRKSAHYLMSAGVDLARDLTDGDNVRHRYWVDGSGVPTTGVTNRVTASIPDGTFDSYASFAQSEWYLAPRWTANLGGRYTHYRYRTQYGLMAEASGPAPATYFQPLKSDDDALCGSLGLVFAARPDLHLTASVANGYRQPNAQDLFFNGPGSVGTVLGNPALRPEKSLSYDLGMRWGPSDLALAGNLFYSTYDDLIDAIQVAAPPAPGAPATYQYVNVMNARIWGGDLEAEWRFRPQLTSRISLAGAIGDITDADAIRTLYGVDQAMAPLPNVPPFKGTASLRWRDARDRVWVESAARWSWRTNRLPLPTPGVGYFTEFKKEWLVGDVTMGTRLPSGQRLVAGVKNIADRVYRLPVGSIEEPGRSFWASLTVAF